MNWAAYDSVET